jgi:hypothetical protein
MSSFGVRTGDLTDTDIAYMYLDWLVDDPAALKSCAHLVCDSAPDSGRSVIERRYRVARHMIVGGSYPAADPSDTP